MARPHGAPVHLRVDRPTQVIVTVIFYVVAVIVTFAVLRGGDRKTKTFRMLVLVGGALTAVFEPAIDRLGNIWYADKGGVWQLFRLYGIVIGPWVVAIYYWFIGGQTLYTLRRLREGLNARGVVGLYLLFVAMDALFEVSVLKMGGIYTYWGSHQPLWNRTYFPLPGWYLAINGLLPLMGAAFVMVLLSARERHLRWCIPVVMPMSMFGVYAMTSWPTIAAINSSVSLAVADLLAIGTILLALLTMFVFTRVLPKLAAAVEIPGAAPAPDGRAVVPGRTVSRPSVADPSTVN